jgi:hypothetical protein
VLSIIFIHHAALIVNAKEGYKGHNRARAVYIKKELTALLCIPEVLKEMNEVLLA